MKKTVSVLLAALLLAGALAGCGGTPAAERGSAGEKRLSVVTTIFPEYDWVLRVLGDRAADVEVTMLLDSGVDLHSYQPTADDMIRISTCDLFIYVGGASDSWVGDALKTAVNKDMVVIDLMDVLGDAVKEEELVEGMEADHDHDEAPEYDEEEELVEGMEADHDHDHDEADHDHGEAPEYDEHVWLSLRCAGTLCAAIRDALIRLDGAHRAAYEANTDAYLDQINALNARYQAAVDGAARKTVLFGDRFPFRYLTDDYGLDYYAAFVGCSAETEASFETVAFLAGKVKELALPVILTLEGGDRRLAETVVSSSGEPGVRILSMDSMQSVTARDVQGGASYLGIMEKNLAVLQQALY